MLQTLRNRRNRKGFTLAELLIVVAIIAVLVAIAVPLFVGSLSKAQKARDNANIRAVRGAAVVYLLEHSDQTASGQLWYNVGATSFTGWNVDATVTASGEIKDMNIVQGAVADATYALGGNVTSSGSDFKIQLHIDNTEITATSTTPSSTTPSSTSPGD